MTGAPPKPSDCQKPLPGAPVIGFRDLLDDVFEQEMEAAINESLATLPEEIQTILRLRFFDKMTLQAIGDRIGMTREKVRQREETGLRKLRHPVRIRRLMEWMEYCNERESSNDKLSD